MINTIIDLYHGNSVDLKAAKAGGILAVIHKATEGASVVDSQYLARRDAAKALGLLWGGYHFSSGSSVADQVRNFLTHALPANEELIALDWEPSSEGPNMTLDQAHHFVQMIKDETGRWPMLYGGSLLRESLGQQSDSILSNCPLWYCRLAPAPIGIPTQVWPSYTLWQYTDGNSGPQPHSTPGADANLDRNIFQGTAQDLLTAWPFTRPDENGTVGAGFAAIMAATPPAVPASANPKTTKKAAA